MRRNTIKAADKVTVIITKANRVTKLKVGTTETITNIKPKVMAAMGIIISIVTTIGVTTSTTGVTDINTAGITIETEVMGTTDLITDPTLTDMDHMLITLSPIIHTSRLRLT